MSELTLSALACAACFSALLGVTVWRGPLSRESAAVAAACGLSVAWAAALAFGDFGLAGLAALLESAASLAWILFLELLLAPSLVPRIDARLKAVCGFVALGVGAAVLFNDASYLGRGSVQLATTQILGREGLAIIGLLLVENLYRNTSAKQHWNVVPLCIAVGGLFAYQLFLYSDALLLGRINPSFAAAQPLVGCLVVPFLALTLARNRNWRLGLHLSRRVVLHSVTLLASGIFLVGIGAVGGLLREAGGGWGDLIQVTAVFASLLLLAAILSSGSARARLKYFVTRNFFTQRYDYRIEWMKFIDMLSARGESEAIKRRVIQGIADIIDSPGGALWLRLGGESADEGGHFAPVALWNTRLPPGAVEPADSAFVRGLRGGRWIQEFHKGRAYPGLGDCWLAVPLVAQERMIGFITLSPSRAPATLNWESFELLRAVARQAASYIAEERLAQQLHDANQLQDYAKRFAFVAHDIKNLAGQLHLILVNAKRHGDNPEFRADVFGTIDHSVARMNDLLQQLRANQVNEAQNATAIDPVPVIRAVVDACDRNRGSIRTVIDCAGAQVRIAPDELGSLLTHLIDNAVEASPAGAAINLGAQCRAGRLVIEIADEGAGMDGEFIHGELFRPFRTTKSGGHGIGAYQTRELVRAAGGELEVISAPGAGTTMRIVLPLAKEGAVSSAA